MKLAIAAIIAFACLSSGADAAAAVRGSNEDAATAARELGGPQVDEPALVQPRVGTHPDDVDTDHWGLHYSTGSCTCAKDAYIAVYKEAQSQLKMVPLIATDGPATDSIFYKIQREINRLLDFAVCFLHHIDCGCDDGYRFKAFNQYKVSTYQCCCDVNAIRDIIIGGIKELAQWEMTMHMDGTSVHTVVDEALVHKRAQYHLFDRVVWNVYKQSRKVGEVYKESMEDCLEAICADDSLFNPTLPLPGPWDEAYNCNYVQGEFGYPNCQHICDDEGKSVCVRIGTGGVGDCSSGGDAFCVTNYGPNYECIQDTCVLVYPKGTPCP